VGGVWTALAQSQTQPRHGRAIQFSEPKSEIITTNLEPESSGQTALRNLDAELKKPFEIFSPGNSLDGVLIPPVRQAPTPTLKSKKARELLDKKRDWWANSEAEMFGLKQSPEDIFKMPEYGPDGKEKKKPETAVERFFDHRDREAVPTNSAGAYPGSGALGLDEESADKERNSDREDRRSRARPGESDPDARRGTDKADAANPASVFQAQAQGRTFAEFFGFTPLNTPEKVAEKNPAREARMEEFKQLIESRSTALPAANAPFSSVSAWPNATTPSLPSSFSPLPASPTRDSFNSFAAPAPSSTPAFQGLQALPSLPSTPAATTLAPAFAPPTTPSSARPLTPAPVFELPKRKY
jgi:hypothetical protein